MIHHFVESTRLHGEVRLFLVRGDLTDNETRRLMDGETRLRKRILEYKEHRNLITNTGRAGFANRVITGSTISIPSHLAVGTTAITPTATDTVLTGESFRKALSTIAVFSTYYMRFAVNFTAADFSATVLGMGLFTASSAGDMWAIVGTSIVKSSSEALVVEWRAQVLSS